ncbi:hypothetical protein XI08_11675 [Bradyrhizobium sp. CCBAU 11361]|nr:hypothetical protein [Bradyrhizobium sp. CCBAU 11361]
MVGVAEFMTCDAMRVLVDLGKKILKTGSSRFLWTASTGLVGPSVCARSRSHLSWLLAVSNAIRSALP